MRASPPFQATLRCFGVWRWSVAFLTLLGLASVGAWLVMREQPAHLLHFVASAVGCIAVVGAGVSLTRINALVLRWDGQTWSKGAVGESRETMVAGSLSVSIDLGFWMLFRFVPATSLRAPIWRPRIVWIPAQRIGLNDQWHALRCAVYSGRQISQIPGDEATSRQPATESH